jgi:uncharacterized protein YndB with AHSA1/START domain
MTHRLETLMQPDPLTLSLRAEGDRQIVMERSFAAPVARVYAAFTEPHLLRRWMDTPEWPLTVCESQLEVGGAIRYAWGSGTGPAMVMRGTWLVLDAPHRLEHTEVFDEDWTGGEVHVTTQFLDQVRGGTLVRMTMTYGSTEARDRVLSSGMAHGMDLNYLQLDDLLGGRDRMFVLDEERDLVLQRVVKAPPSKLWAAWTQPELLAKWFAPAPWSVASATVEPHPGGAFDVRMASPEGEVMEQPPGCVLAVVPRRLLVWTDAMGPGFVPRDEAFMSVVVQLRPHPEGTAYRVLVRHASAEARAKHEAMGFEMGWGAAADQLEALVAQQAAQGA